MKYKIIAFLVWTLAAVVAGYYIKKPTVISKIEVREVGKPVYKYVKQIDRTDIDELWNAYQSPIKITHSTDEAYIFIKASDGYKETSTKLEVYQSNNFKFYAIVGGVAFIGGAAAMVKVLK